MYHPTVQTGYNQRKRKYDYAMHNCDWDWAVIPFFSTCYPGKKPRNESSNVHQAQISTWTCHY